LPTKTVTTVTTVCVTCGKKSCSGEQWEFISLTQHPNDYFFKSPGKPVDMSTLPKRWPRIICNHSSGRAKFLKGHKVGDEVTLRYQNWSCPTIAVVRKIED
jgi:hypothetical protein